MTTDDVATNEIPELIESIEPMLTVPDPAAIRSEAARRRTTRHRVGALGAVAAAVAVLGASTVFGGDEPTQTETAAAGLSSTTSPPTTGFQNPSDEFDATRAFAGNNFRVRSTDNAPIELPPNIGHLSFDFDTDNMAFTTGCEGASYQIDWTSSGFVVERQNPGPAVAANVSCIWTDVLSPFRDGDVVDVRPGDVAGSFDLTVLGQTTWTMSVSEPKVGGTAVDETEFPRQEEADAKYRECALDLGVDPHGEQVIFSSNGTPVFVKTGVDVPADVHLPCLTEIGGPALGEVSGSSHSQGTVIDE